MWAKLSVTSLMLIVLFYTVYTFGISRYFHVF